MTGHAAGGRRRYQLGVGNGGQARAGASDSDDEGSGVEGRQRVQRWHAHYRQRRGRRQQLRDACRVRATRSLSQAAAWPDVSAPTEASAAVHEPSQSSTKAQRRRRARMRSHAACPAARATQPTCHRPTRAAHRVAAAVHAHADAVCGVALCALLCGLVCSVRALLCGLVCSVRALLCGLVYSGALCCNPPRPVALCARFLSRRALLSATRTLKDGVGSVVADLNDDVGRRCGNARRRHQRHQRRQRRQRRRQRPSRPVRGHDYDCRRGHDAAVGRGHGLYDVSVVCAVTAVAQATRTADAPEQRGGRHEKQHGDSARCSARNGQRPEPLCAARCDASNEPHFWPAYRAHVADARTHDSR